MINILSTTNKVGKLRVFIFVLLAMTFTPMVWADENDAKNILKAMSDYMGKQKTISFDLDSSLDVVTVDQQRLSIVNSSTVNLSRPNSISVSRKGGFSETDLVYNGKTLWVLRKDKNVYAKVDISGSIENLIDVLTTKFQRPLPGADLLLANFYDEVMPLVTNVKDLGSGYIRGQECDHLAFKTDELDWQIWIAQGSHRYPVRMKIVSTKIPGTPQYQLDVIQFKSGKEAPSFNFEFKVPKGAREVETTELRDFDELPEIFKPQN